MFYINSGITTTFQLDKYAVVCDYDDMLAAFQIESDFDDFDDFDD